jgi:hypothetical protein
MEMAIIKLFHKMALIFCGHAHDQYIYTMK